MYAIGTPASSGGGNCLGSKAHMRRLGRRGRPGRTAVGACAVVRGRLCSAWAGSPSWRERRYPSSRRGSALMLFVNGMTMWANCLGQRPCWFASGPSGACATSIPVTRLGRPVPTQRITASSFVSAVGTRGKECTQRASGFCQMCVISESK